jgi:replicative DNA helicase
MAGHCGFPSLYVSTEMPLLELLRRTIARETSTFLGKLRTGELGPKESVRLALAAAEKCPDLAFVDGLRSKITSDQMIAYGTALKVQAQTDNVLIILDSAQAWIRQRMNGGTLDEYSATNSAIGDLLEVADAVQCPVTVISHKNRQGNKGEAAAAHSSKGSGDWEYLIESGTDLGIDKEAGKDDQGRKTVMAEVWKNRHGEPHVTQPLKFDGRIQLFTESEWTAARRGAK